MAAAGLALCLLFGCVGNTAPSVLYFTGPDSGRLGDTLRFRIMARDPEYNNVTFLFDWGDTTTPRWSVFFQPYDTVERTHVFSDTGLYQVRAKARDVDRAESPWTVPLPVRIGR